jgi:nicotinamidase-related amidase
MTKTALVVVDMQRYYLDRGSPFVRYFEQVSPGSMGYIMERCSATVIPNIRALACEFRNRALPVFYLRLCGSDPRRMDLHRFFRESWRQALESGFSDIYPLKSDPMADVAPDIQPQWGDPVIDKTTFSAFTSAGFEKRLAEAKVDRLVFTGLATSQCVETTARDASDRGYGIVHVEDAQADYDETTHMASLFSSRGVCGGEIVSTQEFMRALEETR